MSGEYLFQTLRILLSVSGHGFGDLSQAGGVINALATITTGFFVEVSLKWRGLWKT